MGCDCDAGYGGPDCSEKQCKYGVDPLYLDDVSTVKYSTFNFATITDADLSVVLQPTAAALFTDGQYEKGTGTFSIRFYDNFGEDWVTNPIPAGASCPAVVSALEALPNNVIPSGYTLCTRVAVFNDTEESFDIESAYYDAEHPQGSLHPYRLFFKLAFWELYTPADQGEVSKYTPLQLYANSNQTQGVNPISGFIYKIKFTGNPGALKQPDIELYLDGKRPSLVTPSGKVVTKVWTDGSQGEDEDYFADHCDGVTVTISKTVSQTTYLTGFTLAEKALLKTCLGESDFDSSNNQDVYNWDKGSKLYPHVIKLVRTVSSYQDQGYYAALWYDTSVKLDNLGATTDGTFKLLNPFYPPDDFATDGYEVYTTKGVLALTSNKSEAAFGFASKIIYTVNQTYDILRNNLTASHYYDGDISCEETATNAHKFSYIFHCLNKSDAFTLLNWELPQYNPPHINLYTATKLYKKDYQYSVKSNYAVEPALRNNEMHYFTNVITTDLSTNWGVSADSRYAPSGTHPVNFFSTFFN
jgi:hypothetical protein